MKIFSDVCDCGNCNESMYTVDKYGLIWSLCGDCDWWYINI